MGIINKKPAAASKPASAPKPKMRAASAGEKRALGVDSLQSGKSYPFTKEALARKAAPSSKSTAALPKKKM